MNASEIDQAYSLAIQIPEYAPYVKYLNSWRIIVDSHSDGWAYWPMARRCADKLVKLVEQVAAWVRSGGNAPHRLPQPAKPTLAAFRAALIPIKSFATRHKLPAPTFGETPLKLIARLAIGDRPTIEVFSDPACLEIVLHIPDKATPKPVELRLTEDEVDDFIYTLKGARNHIK